MTEFPVNERGEYEIVLDPDDELPFAIAWYWFLRGDDGFWAPRIFVAPGEIFTPAKAALNGHRYRCMVGGTTGSSAPTWPTSSGATVTDGGVTWKEIGAEDTIATSTWDAGALTDTGDTVDATDTVASVVLSNATEGVRYKVTNTITTADGKVKSQSFYVVGGQW